MATINQLKPEQLRDPEIFERIKELAYPFILHIDGREAHFLQEKLESLLETSKLADLQPELYEKYQDLITQLNWAAFSIFSDEDMMKTLKKSYLTALDDEDINVLDRMEAKMFSVGLFPRNEIRQKMQRALKENEERLGERTFGEWLLDYSRTFDFRERDEMTPLKYVRENPKAQTLSETERNKLRKAFEIFDKTLLVTPVMSEPAFSMTVREMIKAGTIKEQINPALLQRFAPATSTKPKPEPKPEPEPEPEPKPEPEPEPKLVTPVPPPPKIEKETPKGPAYEISPYERKRETPLTTLPVQEEIQIPEAKKEADSRSTSPGLKKQEYQIRTMKQDIERAKKKPIPPKPKPKIKDNVVDLSGK